MLSEVVDAAFEDVNGVLGFYSKPNFLKRKRKEVYYHGLRMQREMRSLQMRGAGGASANKFGKIIFS